MRLFDASTWLLVLNPVSGRGAGLRDRQRIEAALAARGLRHQAVVSEYAGHTISLVAEAVTRGCRRVLVGGGDGSLNEAANGIFGQSATAPGEIVLALLPIGTGNDWARMHGIPHDYQSAASVVAAGRTRLQDIGTVDFPATGARRHFVNVAGVGFDAGVVERMPTRKLGRLAYLIGLLRELAAYRPLSLRWRNGGHEDGVAAFVLFACLGRYCGGGMQVAPAARDDDGLLDMTLIRHLGRLEVVRSLSRLFDGTLAQHPKVSTWQVESIEILAPAGAAVETDGELAGQLPATLSVRRRALSVVVP